MSRKPSRKRGRKPLVEPEQPSDDGDIDQTEAEDNDLHQAESDDVEPPIKRRRGRPSKYDVPTSHGQQRVFQRDPAFAPLPITNRRLLTAAGRQSTSIRPRRWKKRPPTGQSLSNNQSSQSTSHQPSDNQSSDVEPAHQPAAKQPYHLISDDQSNWIVNERILDGRTVTDIRERYFQRYHNRLSRDNVYKILQRAAINGGSANKQKPKGKPKVYDAADQEWYNQTRLANSTLRATDISLLYEDHRRELGLPIDPHHLLSGAQQSRFKRDALITRKRTVSEPVQRNAPITIEARRRYAHDALSWPDDLVIYIDECGIDRSLEMTYGYSEVGEPAISSSVESGVRLNIIGAITAHGVLHFEFSLLATNAETYATFISNMIRNNQEAFNSNHYHLIHDGVAFHSMENVHDVLTSQPLQHLFHVIPPYSPALNAIENFWLAVRKRATARFPDLINHDHPLSLQTLVEECIEAVPEESFMGFHQGVKKALLTCVEGRPLAANSGSVEYSIDEKPIRYVNSAPTHAVNSSQQSANSSRSNPPAASSSSATSVSHSASTHALNSSQQSGTLPPLSNPNLSRSPRVNDSTHSHSVPPSSVSQSISDRESTHTQTSTRLSQSSSNSQSPADAAAHRAHNMLSSLQSIRSRRSR